MNEEIFSTGVSDEVKEYLDEFDDVCTLIARGQDIPFDDPVHTESITFLCRVAMSARWSYAMMRMHMKPQEPTIGKDAFTPAGQQ